MDEWKETSLRDVSEEITYGYTASATMNPTGTKFLRITDIVNEPFDWDTVPFCEISDKDKQKYKLHNGDIVIARTGATTGYNRTIQSVQNAVFASYLIRYKINPQKADPFYVGYNLKSYEWKGYVENIMGGSAQPGANAQQFANYEFLLPPLPEQQAIAEVLGSLDDKIDLLHRNNRILEEMAETLFLQWFVVEAGNDWDKVLLGDFVSVLRGLSYKGSGLTERNDPKAVPMVNLNSIYERGSFKHEGIKYYNGEYKVRHEVYPGDVIVANTEQGHEYRLIGYPAIVPRRLGKKGIFSQHVFKVIPKTDRLTSHFLYHLLSTPSVHDQIIGATNGTTVNMLSAVGIEKAEVSLPKNNEIREFEDLVTPVYKKKEDNEDHIHTLEQLRDTLLPKLMSGEVRVTF